MKAMKLIGFIGLMGWLMGCSSDSKEQYPTEPMSSTPITFSANQGEEQTVTRAGTSLHDKGVSTFKVWGYKNMSYIDGTESYGDLQTVFPGYTVNWTSNSSGSTTTNSNGWDYVNLISSTGDEQSIKYWDWNAEAYRFFGVTGNLSGTRKSYEANGDHEAYEAYEIEMSADGSTDATVAATPYFSHLWFSTGNTSTYPGKAFGQPVQLEYLKPFAKVRFMFIFENPNDAKETTLTEKSFRPTNGDIIQTSAQITVSYPLSGTATQETYAISSVPGGIEEFGQDYYETVTKETINGVEHVTSPYYDALESECNKEYVVLPATNQGTYALTVSVNGEPKTTVVPAEFMDWKIGYLYTYIFKVHVDYSVSIDVVQSAFTTWSTDFETDHTVYNW